MNGLCSRSVNIGCELLVWDEKRRSVYSRAWSDVSWCSCMEEGQDVALVVAVCQLVCRNKKKRHSAWATTQARHRQKQRSERKEDAEIRGRKRTKNRRRQNTHNTHTPTSTRYKLQDGCKDVGRGNRASQKNQRRKQKEEVTMKKTHPHAASWLFFFVVPLAAFCTYTLTLARLHGPPPPPGPASRRRRRRRSWPGEHRDRSLQPRCSLVAPTQHPAAFFLPRVLLGPDRGLGGSV